MWLKCGFFFFSSRRRHTILQGDWSSDVCSSDLSAASPLASTNSSAALSTFSLVSRGRAATRSALPPAPVRVSAAAARGVMVPPDRSFTCKLTSYGLPSISSLRYKDDCYGGIGMAAGRRDDRMTDGQPAIELSGLTKRYRRGKGWLTAVDDVTLAVPAGQVIGLLGPNGAGKTTTIKMACGLILPTAGTIRINGYDVGRQRADAVRQIGAVLEGSRNVYWPLTAWQNLMYFGRLKGLSGTEIKPRAQRLLTGLGLWDRRDETVGSYSRGMQQKVAIAT